MKIFCLKHKISERGTTIFDTALKSHHENPITEILAFFLEPKANHGLNTSFYNGFVEAIRINDY